MNRQIVAPEALDWTSVGRRDYFVKFEHPTLWGHHLTPVTIIVGPDAKAGQGVVAVGSTHGNEYEGPIAIKHIMGELKAEDVKGRLVLIPVLNSAAFQAGTRDTPDDGVNLNRAFPGQVDGSLTYRLADFVSRFVFPNVHVVIDLHAGGRVARFPQMMSFHKIDDPEQREAMESTAREFGAPFVMIYQNKTAGLLTSMAEQLGKITLGSELGYGQATHRLGVAMGRQGILRAAHMHGQLATAPPPQAHMPADEQKLVDTSEPACSLLAPFVGHFEPCVDLGEAVVAGQLLGYLHDFNHIDEAPYALRAPHDGYVLCQAWEAAVIRGQVISQVGIPVDWE